MGKRTRSARMGAQVMRLIDADAIPWFVDGVGNIPVIGKDEVDEMPTIDAVSVKHGEWVGVMTEEWCTFDECKCSVCGVVEYFNKGWKKFNYCPNCGAKMDGERKDDGERKNSDFSSR